MSSDVLNPLVEIPRYMPVKKQSHFYVAPCPFHEESVPSFSVDLTTKTYYCVTCGKKGTATDLMKFLQERQVSQMKADMETKIRKEIHADKTEGHFVHKKTRKTKKGSD